MHGTGPPMMEDQQPFCPDTVESGSGSLERAPRANEIRFTVSGSPTGARSAAQALRHPGEAQRQ